jgi:two-component system, NarL family, response regulator NreC
MQNDVIRVVLVDDHAVVRAGLRMVLRSAADIVVVGEAAGGVQAIALADQLRPDLIVMDLSMGGLDGVAASREILGRHPGIRILVLTMHAEAEYLADSRSAGVSGYLLKSAAERELIDAVRVVAHGDNYVQPTAGRVHARGIRRPRSTADDRGRFERLTDREQEVLRLVAAGYSATGVGAQLGISSKTVDTYKQRIHEKLGLAGRPEYVQFALRLGLLTAGAD